MKTVKLAALCIVAVAALTSCSESVGGAPQASDGTKAGSTQTSPRATSSAPATSGLASLDPCELLTSADVARLGTKPGEAESSVGGNKVCNFQASGKFLVGITVRPATGVAQLNTQGMTASAIKVGKHEAQKFLDSVHGVCLIVMAITDRSSVGVSGAITAGGSAEAGCPYANEVATIIEPKLP